MPVIRLTESTVSKLKLLAIPLEDNFDSVIGRLADTALERKVYELPRVGDRSPNEPLNDKASPNLSSKLHSSTPPKASDEEAQTMDEAELNYILGKIGKEVFVTYFRAFQNEQLSNQQVIAMLPSEYTFKSRTSRTSKSRLIFRQGLESQALVLIINSNRISPEIRLQAKKLLEDLE